MDLKQFIKKIILSAWIQDIDMINFTNPNKQHLSVFKILIFVLETVIIMMDVEIFMYQSDIKEP